MTKFKMLIILLALSILPSCHQGANVRYNPKLELYTVEPKDGFYTIEYGKDNPNVINIKSKKSDLLTAWVVVDKNGIKSAQLLGMRNRVNAEPPSLSGAIIRKDNRVERIKGFKTGIIVRDN